VSALLPYGRQSISEGDIDAVAAVLRGDWLTTGPAVAEFEQALVNFTGAATCVSVTSGTAALHVAYAAAGIGPGDEVVTTPLTFAATASCAILLGATVVFADVEEDTGNLDAQAAESAVTSRTKVVAAVDFAGHPAEMDALRKVADGAGALLIEDAAHSIGSLYHDRKVGTLADLTTFSFFPTKNMTTGEGGAVAAVDPVLGQRAARFHNHGLVRDRAEQRYPDEGPWHQEVHEVGLNYRLPDVLCVLGTSQLARIDAFKARRREISRRYDEELADLDGVRVPARRPYVDPMWHLYPLRVLGGRRREVFDKLRAAGIGVQVNYIPVYWHPAFEDMGYRRGMCPRAEAYYLEEISLPMFVDLTEDDQSRVIDAVRRALAG
jgi:UDP-4-amino-4,6-dideoxy-N-acetyl-beta-L-altrosamine transaminase